MPSWRRMGNRRELLKAPLFHGWCLLLNGRNPRRNLIACTQPTSTNFVRSSNNRGINLNMDHIHITRHYIPDTVPHRWRPSWMYWIACGDHQAPQAQNEAPSFSPWCKVTVLSSPWRQGLRLHLPSPGKRRHPWSCTGYLSWLAMPWIPRSSSTPVRGEMMSLRKSYVFESIPPSRRSLLTHLRVARSWSRWSCVKAS